MFARDVYAGDFHFELCNTGVPRNSRMLRYNLTVNTETGSLGLQYAN